MTSMMLPEFWYENLSPILMDFLSDNECMLSIPGFQSYVIDTTLRRLNSTYDRYSRVRNARPESSSTDWDSSECSVINAQNSTALEFPMESMVFEQTNWTPADRPDMPSSTPPDSFKRKRGSDDDAINTSCVKKQRLDQNSNVIYDIDDVIAVDERVDLVPKDIAYTGHTTQVPFNCSFQSCSKSFKGKYRLRRHELTHGIVDLSKRSMQCYLCKIYCSDKAKLTMHMLVHTGHRPFQCPFADCTKSFKRKYHLKTHHSRVHNAQMSITV